MKISRILFALALLLPLPALALSLDQAKQQGLVGEQADGFLGAVSAPTPEVSALVKDVNTRRLDIFKGIAAKNGQSLEAVEAVSGEEFISRTPSGQYVRDAKGNWLKK